MENTEKRDLYKEHTTHVVKYKGKEISVSNMKYATCKIFDNPHYKQTGCASYIYLYIHKGYESNVYYLVYSDVVILSDTSVKALLNKYGKCISKVDGLDNKVRFVKKPYQ